jgi:hypothetical protein
MERYADGKETKRCNNIKEPGSKSAIFGLYIS